MDPELKEIKSSKARSFVNAFRHIDDLCAINDNVLFEKNFKEICP